MKALPSFKLERQILQSGNLRQLLKLQLISIAFGPASNVSIKAIVELLLLPEAVVDDWTVGLSTAQLMAAKGYIDEQLMLEIYEQVSGEDE